MKVKDVCVCVWRESVVCVEGECSVCVCVWRESVVCVCVEGECSVCGGRV